MLLIALIGSAFRSCRACLAGRLFINALRHGLKIQEGLLCEILARWRLIHLLGRLVLLLSLRLRARDRASSRTREIVLLLLTVLQQGAGWRSHGVRMASAVFGEGLGGRSTLGLPFRGASGAVARGEQWSWSCNR